nr:hypothetical protein [Nanoarchaeota archaeon]
MKTDETSQIQVVDSGVKVSLPVISKPVIIERRVSCETIGKDMTSRITGKLIGFDDLYDPKTKTFKTEDELKAQGAVFITVNLDKVLGDSDVNKKSRITKNPTPFIRKTSSYQVIGNVNWTSYVNKRGHGDFVSAEQRSNGVENFENCKAIGKTRADNFTINGVAFRVIEKTKYYDENGREYTDIIGLKNEYFKKTYAAEQKAKQREADKHGIDVRFDPKYRTTRIDSCKSIRCFGFEYKPTENHLYHKPLK